MADVNEVEVLRVFILNLMRALKSLKLYSTEHQGFKGFMSEIMKTLKGLLETQEQITISMSYGQFYYKDLPIMPLT